MPDAVAPATPASQSAQAGASTPNTGTWRHPRLDEITRRQHASTFDDKNVRAIVRTLTLLLATFVAVPASSHIFPGWVTKQISSLLASFSHWPSTLLVVVRLLLLVNIVVALFPLFRNKDDLSDIPLTPSQRALLGLGPSSAPATPGSLYITPPRYARSTTPRSSSPRSLSQSRGSRDSPLVAFNTQRESSPGRSISQSPFSPVASPLLQKAVSGGAHMRRHSFGGSTLGAQPIAGSVLSASVSSGSFWMDSSSGSLPSTPTPAPGAKGPSVGLSNRWLYERGSRNLGARGLFT